RRGQELRVMQRVCGHARIPLCADSARRCGFGTIRCFSDCRGIRSWCSKDGRRRRGRNQGVSCMNYKLWLLAGSIALAANGIALAQEASAKPDLAKAKQTA